MPYKQLYSNETILLHSGKLLRVACCGCGLVHDFYLVKGKDVIFVTIVGNKKATDRRRKRCRMQQENVMKS